MNPVRSEAANPYLQGLYAPVEKEITAENLEVIGEIPRDLDGVIVRNGPNPRFAPKGRYHWFDGDGMLHAVHFRDGRATYRNRYVRTIGFERETTKGGALWSGLREPMKHNPSEMPLKDTANTDVIFHNRSLVALWYVSGKPYRLDAVTLETLGVDDFGGRRAGNVSAHAKVDAQTGELLFFDYGPRPPFMTYGVVSAEGELKHFVPIELPGPRLPHDMAFTENYSILFDLPVLPDAAAAERGQWVTRFHRDKPARFGVIPRFGAPDSIRWFEGSACYIYHTINAWEEGDEIVLVSCRTTNPVPEMKSDATDLDRMLAFLTPTFDTWRWRFNLKTGATSEEQVDDQHTEFPSINLNVMGRRSRYSYHVHIPQTETLLFDGLTKYETDTGRSRTHHFGTGRYGSEAPFAPRVNAQAEDDGYVLSFVSDENDGSSELVILDAQNITDPPIGRVRIPQRVPLGFHATWVSGNQLRLKEN
jgi:carotenoid cleavage dioxygenase